MEKSFIEAKTIKNSAVYAAVLPNTLTSTQPSSGCCGFSRPFSSAAVFSAISSVH